MSAWLLALVVLAVVLGLALSREFARLEREALLRRLRALSSFRKMAADLGRFKVEIGTALLPALRQMGEVLMTMQPQIQRLAGEMPKRRWWQR